MIWHGLKVQKSRTACFLSSFGPLSNGVLEFLKENGLPMPIPLPISSSHLQSPPYSSFSCPPLSSSSLSSSNSLNSSYNLSLSSSSVLPPSSPTSYFALVLDVYLKNRLFHQDLGEIVNLAGKRNLISAMSPNENVKILEAMRVSGQYKEALIDKVVSNLTPHFSSLLPSELASLLYNLAHFSHGGFSEKIRQLEIRSEYLGEMAFYSAVFFDGMRERVKEIIKKVDIELNHRMFKYSDNRYISHFLQTCHLFIGEGASVLSRLPDRKRVLRISYSQQKFGALLMKEIHQKQQSIENNEEANRPQKKLYPSTHAFQSNPKQIPFSLSEPKTTPNNPFLLEEEKKLGVYHVDFLLNERIIIEINGPFHYLSAFPKKENGYESSRRRNLERMGFQVFTVEMNEMKGEESIQKLCRKILEKFRSNKG